MKNKIFITSIIFLICNVAFANQVVKPEKCPSVESIQAAGWSRILSTDTNLNAWTAVQNNNKYDTADEWTFVMGDIRAQDQQEATIKSNHLLKTLHFYLGPIGDGKLWACYYDTSNQVVGIAMTGYRR